VVLSRSNVNGNGTKGFGASGGGIHANGLIRLTGSTANGNSATGPGGGIYTPGTRPPGSVILEQSAVNGNTSAGEGGGIYASGVVTLTESMVNGNVSDRSGGGISTTSNASLTRSSVSDNRTTKAGARGGGIELYTGGATLTQSTVSGNRTEGVDSPGGGIFTFGVVTLNQSTLSGNSTAGANSWGGGISSGGGLTTGGVTLFQSTLSDNVTTGSGSHGGGIFTAGGVSLVQATLTSNRAMHGSSNGGGAFNNANSRIEGSIVAGNAAGGSGADVFESNANSTLTVVYSLIGTGVMPDAGSPSTVVRANNPLLGPLADNGGLTRTHALLPGSAAIDAGDPNVSFASSEFDQRGAPYSRVFDGDAIVGARIDIGAFEFLPSGGADSDANGRVDGNDFLAWQRGLGATGLAAVKANGNADNDSDVDAADLAVWRAQFGAAITNEASIESHLAAAAGQATPILSSELVDAAMAYHCQMTDEGHLRRPDRLRFVRAR
jgi:predicted outer membrane repeat protein